MSHSTPERLRGFVLLNRVHSLDPTFESGAPWRGKEQVVIQCGYARKDSKGTPVPQYGDFHEAFEDATIFQEMFAEGLRGSSEDPQELFEAFFSVREETFFLDEVIEQLKTFGIDYILELRNEFRTYESERCTDLADL
jgi:hypothetical protein